MDAAASDTISQAARTYLRFQLADNVGPIILGRLLERFSTIEGILSASPSELAEVEGVGRVRVAGLLQARDGGQLDEEIARAERSGVRIICREDPDYPAQLSHIPDPPLCLYLRGSLQPADAVAIAVVGSRRCSYYGIEQTQRFASGLASLGFTIVSGLARGIDGHAHRAALAAGGRTVAVLGNGLASVYPPEHAELADQVAGSGAVLSELPMLIGPEAGHFPRRNRIIVGLSLGVLVVEAGRRSGALISARLASEYNREVFAVPGRVDVDKSAGTNSMIRGGQAKLVASLEDVLDELGDVGRIMVQPTTDSPDQAPGATLPLTPEEQRVIDAIGDDEADLEVVCQRSALGVAKVTATLTSLQLKGQIRRLPGNVYARRKPQT